jgi:ubiquitin-like 1-activating enzyme E1 B
VDTQLTKFADRHSPSKKRRLEEDGLVEMDGPNEVLGVLDNEPADSNIIVIDDD